MPLPPDRLLDPVAELRRKEANRALLDALASRSSIVVESAMIRHIEQALADGADVNVRATLVDHGPGLRPLHIAAKHGVPRAVVELLVQRGAKVGTALKNGETALHLAAKHGRTHLVDALLDVGADLQGRTKAGHTPLGSALVQGERNLAMVEHLLARGAALDEISGSEPHPLHHAVRKLDVPTVAFLLDHGVSPDTRDPMGSLPFGALRSAHAFDHAAFMDATVYDAPAMAIADALINAGADMNAKVTPHSGETALSYLLQAQRIPLPMVHRLIDAGSSPHGQEHPSDHRVNSPVSFAMDQLAVRGEHIVLQTLVDRGVDLTRANKFGETLLHRALDTSRLSRLDHVKATLTLLIAAGVDVNAQMTTSVTSDASGVTPLYLALLNERSDIARMATEVLLEHGANPNLLAGPKKLAPLVVAAKPNEAAAGAGRSVSERWPLVDLLLNHKADPFATLPNKVPLMLSAAIDAEIVARLGQDLTDFRKLANGVVQAIAQGEPRVGEREAERVLPLAFKLGLSPQDILGAYERLRDTLRADTIRMFEAAVIQRLESKVLHDTVNESLSDGMIDRTKPRARL